MTPVKTTIAVALVALAGLVLPSDAVLADVPQLRQSGAISFISGGISEEERFGLDAMARDFNVKLVFATRSGEYLSDVRVVVSGGRGQPVLDVKSDGPWFFARLPGGQYRVSATAPNGQAMQRTVSVGTRGLRTLDFRWGSLDSPGGRR